MWAKILLNGGSLLGALPLQKILLYSIAMLLTATLVLGTLLKHQIERAGALESRLEQAYRGQASLRLSLDKEKASCKETVTILEANIRAKEQADKATEGLLRQVEEVLYERGKGGSNGSGAAMLKLLDSATCQARNNGIPCRPNNPTK